MLLARNQGRRESSGEKSGGNCFSSAAAFCCKCSNVGANERSVSFLKLRYINCHFSVTVKEEIDYLFFVYFLTSCPWKKGVGEVCLSMLTDTAWQFGVMATSLQPNLLKQPAGTTQTPDTWLEPLPDLWLLWVSRLYARWFLLQRIKAVKFLAWWRRDQKQLQVVVCLAFYHGW